MVDKLLSYFAFAALLFLFACGGADSFTVIGEVEGLGTQNVHAIYRVNGRYVQVTNAALDGKFTFSGVSSKPTMVDIYSRTNKLLGSVIVMNGETVEVKLKVDQPAYMDVKGDDMSVKYSRFLKENSTAVNSADSQTLNNAIGSYISKNPNDPVATYILISLFDSKADVSLADSLLSLLGDRALSDNQLVASYRESLYTGHGTLSVFEPLRLYTSGDSVTTVAPKASRGLFLAVQDTELTEPYDSIAARYNRLKKQHSDLVVVELSLVADTAMWHSQLGEVKPEFTRCWEPGEISSPSLAKLHIGQLPWFVVTDSLGNVKYAGPEYGRATEFK